MRKENDSFGVEVNFSFVRNNGMYDIGCHYIDSDGKDASSQVKTDSLEEGMSAIIQEITDEIMNNVEEEKEFDLDEYIADLEDQVHSLTVDNKILEDRLNSIITEKSNNTDKNIKNKSSKSEKSEYDILDILDFFLY